METIDIVFTFDNNFVAPAYIAIYSLFEYASVETKYNVIVIYKKISKNNLKHIDELTHNTVHKISFIRIEGKKNNMYAPITSHIWPEVVYYRLYIADILINYSKVIFSDVDILFQDDLSEVWQIDLAGCEFAAVPAEINTPEMVIHQYYEDNKHEYMFMAGFMVLNLDLMRKKNWKIMCNNNLLKYQSRLHMCDLEILNLTAQNIKPLPFRYVFLQSLYDTENIKQADEYSWLSRMYSDEDLNNEKEHVTIIHYAGNLGKPWLRGKIPVYYRKYMYRLPYRLKLQNEKNRVLERLRKKTVYILKKILTANIFKLWKDGNL